MHVSLCLSVCVFVWHELFQGESSVDLTVLRDRRVPDSVSTRSRGCQQRLLPFMVVQHIKEYGMDMCPSVGSMSLKFQQVEVLLQAVEDAGVCRAKRRNSSCADFSCYLA